MGSPMPNTPMSGGQNPPMGGAPQQNSPMSGNQQFGLSPTSTPSQNTFNPYMGGGSSPSSSMGGGGSGSASMNPYMGGGGTASQLSMGPGAQPYSQGIGGLQGLGGQQSQPLYPQQNPYAQDPLFAKQQEFQNQMQSMSSEIMNSIPEYQQLQKMERQLQGRQPSAQEMQQLQALNQQIQGNSNFQQMNQQQQQMGQQFQQQYGNQLAALQAKDRQYNMQQQQMIDAQQNKQRAQASNVMGPGQQRVDGRMPGPGEIGPKSTNFLYASPDRPAIPGMSRDQMIEAQQKMRGMGSAGPNPYETATPLDPKDPMFARTREVDRGQQRMNPSQQLMRESRGMRAATQPYTPVQGQRLNPGQKPQNPMFSRTPGNFAMPVQGQDNAAGKQSLQDMFNASNISSAGRRRLV